MKNAQKKGALLFGINNTFNDFMLDVWIACDPAWHETYSPVKGPFIKWHWDKTICEKFGYNFIQGAWGDGLSQDKNILHYGHSSGFQALGLAFHYGCNPLLLAGYDMRYSYGRRHYFTGLSDKSGEYPKPLRKFSTFDGLIKCYETIAAQKLNTKIINCTPNSALTCFEMGSLNDSNLYSKP